MSSVYLCRWHESLIYSISEVYKVNRNGNRTGPCGALVLLTTTSDIMPPPATQLNSLNTLPTKANQYSSPITLFLYIPSSLKNKKIKRTNPPGVPDITQIIENFFCNCFAKLTQQKCLTNLWFIVHPWPEHAARALLVDYSAQTHEDRLRVLEVSYEHSNNWRCGWSEIAHLCFFIFTRRLSSCVETNTMKTLCPCSQNSGRCLL